MLARRHDALSGIDELVVSDNTVIRSAIDTQRSQSRHDDCPRDVFPGGIVKVQVFYNDVVSSKGDRIAAGIAGSGISKPGEVALPIGSQTDGFGRCSGFTDPNITGERRAVLEVNHISCSEGCGLRLHMRLPWGAYGAAVVAV